MKSFTVKTICILASAFGISHVSAQGLGVYGSYWDPNEGGDVMGIGLHLRGGEELLYYEIRATYFEDISEDTGRETNDFEVIPVDIGLGLQHDITERVNLYGGGGLSYYFLDSQIGSFDDEVGYYFQVGSNLELNESFGLFAEAVFRRVEGTVDSGLSDLDNLDEIDIDENIQIDLDGLALIFGVTYNW
ncbi:hypothetical protein P0Y35_16275 [Kiritimatiellaeota bacterium B1221]|nr:hypothetical protein [Kiritimatiellaeota bacterium B1221]